MYVVLGTIKVKAEHLAEFIDNVREHAANSRREAGCVRYDVLQDLDDPQTICLYEVFRSEADVDTHHQQDYYKRWMALSSNWRDSSSYRRRVLKNVYPEDSAWVG
jgi:autoinducer 2-degrading protein